MEAESMADLPAVPDMRLELVPIPVSDDRWSPRELESITGRPTRFIDPGRSIHLIQIDVSIIGPRPQIRAVRRRCPWGRWVERVQLLRLWSQSNQMGQCFSEGCWRSPGVGEGVAAKDHLLGARNPLPFTERLQIDERFGARESSLE